MAGVHGPCLEMARSLPTTFHSPDLKCHLVAFPEKKGEAGLTNNKPVSSIEMIYFLASSPLHSLRGHPA